MSPEEISQMNEDAKTMKQASEAMYAVVVDIRREWEKVKDNLSDKYSNRELDTMHTNIFNLLNEIKTQTTQTNGKVRKIIIVLIILGSVVGTLLVVNGSSLVQFLTSIIV